MEAERLREIRLKNQQTEQQLRDSQQNTPSASATPEPDISMGLKALYTCGVVDGMLKEALMLGNTTAVNQLREQLKTTNCDDIRKVAGVADIYEQISK